MFDESKEKNPSGKNSPLSVIIASLCICIYLGALVSTAVRIYFHIERQRDAAADEFGYIANLASSAGISGFMDAPFVETVQNALNASATLEALIISGPNGEYPFEKNPGQAINMVNNLPRFKNRFDFSRQPLYMPLSIQNLRNVNIEARANAVDYGQVTDVLKQTLLLVLASLLLAFFTLLIQSLVEKSPARRAERESFYDDDESSNAPFEDNAAGFAVKNEFAEYAAQAPKAQAPKAQAPKVQMPQAQAPESDQPPQKPKTREQPAGLYSPRGNIGWEEYTSARLDFELQRCAASEQELVYLLMEFRDSNDDENFYLSFADDAVAFFTMRDMIFESGKRGIAVILPNMELDAAIAKAGEFHKRCVGKYGGILKSKAGLCIGLSSRSGRLIDAPRLMFEANEALQKALADPVSHIFAFKSDPEKYRAFIASRNAGSV